VAAGRASELEGELTDSEVHVQRVPLVRSIEPATDQAALRAVRRLVRSQSHHIVHTHMAKAGAIGRIAARSVRPRPATVHTFHGHVLEGYFTARMERGFIAAERRLARLTDVFIAVSPEIRDQLLDLGVGRSDQYQVIPLGLDLAPFFAVTPDREGPLRRHLGLTATTPLLGALARLEPVKDHATLLRAMVRLPEAHLAVLGDGALRGELERLAVDLGIERRVHFLGWRQDVPAVLAELDVVALTSRHEGTPVTLIEAAAAGVPVVATDVGGVSQVVVHDRTGSLAPAGDIDTVARELARLVRDETTRRRLGVAAAAHAHSEFGDHRGTEELADVYRRVRPARAI
jgi:glycosyltransferase involved in cell wall biosynthesis